jgi:hypothetical protein
MPHQLLHPLLKALLVIVEFQRGAASLNLLSWDCGLSVMVRAIAKKGWPKPPSIAPGHATEAAGLIYWATDYRERQ